MITTENIKQWFELAHRAKPIYIAGIVVALLFIDLFFSVPTLTITMLSGYFLGPIAGAFAALTGLLLTGTCGYLLSQKYGNWLLTRLEKDPIKRKKAKVAFQQHGAIVIVLSRALPMLPEICACLAGMTGMPFTKFILYWLLSTVPYAIAASFAGAASTPSTPQPALYTAVAITVGLWAMWFCMSFLERKRSKANSSPPLV